MIFRNRILDSDLEQILFKKYFHSYPHIFHTLINQSVNHSGIKSRDYYIDGMEKI